MEAQVKRRSNTLYDLAEDTCFAGLTMAKYRNKDIVIEDAPEFQELPHSCTMPPLTLRIDYQGLPAMGPGETRQMNLILSNHTEKTIDGLISYQAPKGWEIGITTGFSVEAHTKLVLPFTVSTLTSKNCFYENNSFTFYADGNNTRATYSFGIVGATVWTVYGPFWSLHSKIPEIDYWEKYAKYFQHVDDLREYHISTCADIDKLYVDESDFENIKNNESETCSMIPKRVNLYEDCFHLSDFISYQGSCVVYLVRELISDKEVSAVINIGHSAPYKLWLNGQYIAGNDQCCWWTAENTHTDPVTIHKGKNLLVLKAAKIGSNDQFSIVFNDGLFTNHHYDYASGI